MGHSGLEADSSRCPLNPQGDWRASTHSSSTHRACSFPPLWNHTLSALGGIDPSWAESKEFTELLAPLVESPLTSRSSRKLHPTNHLNGGQAEGRILLHFSRSCFQTQFPLRSPTLRYLPLTMPSCRLLAFSRPTPATLHFPSGQIFLMTAVSCL